MENKNFLQEHSLNYIEMALSTDHIEKIENPDGYGKRTGDCGDTVQCFLLCSNDKIEHVAFQVDGCMNTIACCNTVAKFIEGKSVDYAWTLSPEQIKQFLKTLPEDHFHCAELAVGALYLALADLKTNKS
jgi:nitrogen fixation NifU-like protein